MLGPMARASVLCRRTAHTGSDAGKSALGIRPLRRCCSPSANGPASDPLVGLADVSLPSVARSIDGGTRDGDLHLVDGDGASLCEAFTQQQLQRLPLAWAEVVAVARCRVCEVLSSSSARP
jgi:hypothetical protein